MVVNFLILDVKKSRSRLSGFSSGDAGTNLLPVTICNLIT